MEPGQKTMNSDEILAWYEREALPNQEFDVEALARELDLDQQAMNAARIGQPPDSDETLDQNQQQVLTVIRSRLNALWKTSNDALDSLQQRRNALDLSEQNYSTGNVTDMIAIYVDRVLGSHRATLIRARMDHVVDLQNFRFFQSYHNIHHKAVYPDSPMLHWAILSAIILAESVMNGYFFSSSNDLGLLGGLFQAGAISVVNIAMAVLAGSYPLRWMYHQNPKMKVAGAFTLTIWAGIALAFNLAVAHYRGLLESDPLNAIRLVLDLMRRNPLSLDNFDSIVLFLMGVLFGLAAMIKSFRADDRYPRYGALDRQRLATQDAYDQAKQDMRDAVDRAVDDGRREVIESIQRARATLSEFERNIGHTRSVYTEYDTACRDAGDAQKALLQRYRAANTKIRVSPAPAYFSTFPDPPQPHALHDSELDKAETEFQALEGELARLEEVGNTLQSEFKAINDRALESFQALVYQIEREAEQQAEQQRSHRAMPQAAT